MKCVGVVECSYVGMWKNDNITRRWNNKMWAPLVDCSDGKWKKECGSSGRAKDKNVGSAREVNERE